MLEQDWHRKQVVHWSIKEPLDLGGVQIHAHDAIRTGGLEQVSNQASRDGFATAPLLVLPGIRIKGCHHGDALRARTFECVHHDELLHEPLINGGAVGLHDEGVAASNAVAIAGINFPVGKGSCFRRNELGSQLLRDRLGKSGMSTTAHQDKVFLRGGGNRGHGYLSPLRA